MGVGGGRRPEFAEEGQDLVLAFERELDELALGDLDDLVLAGGLGLTLGDLLEGLLLEGGLLLGEHAGKVVLPVSLAVRLAIRRRGTDGRGER